MKSFDIPTFYRSNFIQKVKEKRKIEDPRKIDFSPTVLNFNSLEVILARHFGFCFGVENAIERAYKALADHPDKRIFLISQMIHNPAVNKDLADNGIYFILDTEGNQLIPWDEITSDDVVLIPAFGTTIDIENLLKGKGVNLETYNTTCPFVERVWKKSDKLGKEEFTIIVHGKPKHEETRATFSHSSASAPTIIIKNIEEARILAKLISKPSQAALEQAFEGRFSKGFVVEDLQRVGVVNQTTMLASETQEISDFFKQTMQNIYGEENIKTHFADTRDTLCYATNDNQNATFELLKTPADCAIVIGGYNSSNTTHLVELLEAKFPTYFISSPEKLLNAEEILHFDHSTKQEVVSANWLSKSVKPRVIITSGASCPDKLLEEVLMKIVSFFPKSVSLEALEI